MYEFRPAIRDKTSVLLALAGASGSGKTYTAILIAFGLAYPGMTPEQILETIRAEGKSRVAFIDTEGGRGKHYAAGPDQTPDFRDTFPFDYAEIRAPYTPEAYQEAILAADAQGYHAIILDSASHEYESEGGILEIADQIESGVLKPGKTLADTEDRQDGWKAWLVKPVKSPGNWKEPKTRHKKMVNRAIQSRAHIIFCLRAEEKLLMERVPKLDRDGQPKVWNGQPQFETKVVPAADRPLLDRWQPICEKRFMYEMTVSFLLLPSAPGVGHPIKNLQAQFNPMFPEGERLGVENGRLLAEWSHGRKLGAAEKGSSSTRQPSEPVQDNQIATDAEAGRSGSPAPTNGDRRGRTAEQMVADYEIRVGKLPEDGGFQDLEAFEDFKLDSKTQGFIDTIRAKHPDLHARLVRANNAAYDRLSGAMLPDDDERETVPFGGDDG